MTGGNQRWFDRRSSSRPPGEPIRTADYDVVEIATDTPAKAFVERHHYSGSYPAARFRFGLYERGELAGVAVFSVPVNGAVLTSVFPQLDVADAVELGRFVLLDRVPGNGESWFLARCFELIRDRVCGIVSFSDPWQRATNDGRVVFAGHYGCIYQAHNAEYRGLTKPSTLRLLPDATVFSNRAAGKIARREQGWRHASQQLVRFGAEPLTDLEDSLAWLRRWRAELTRPMRHRGNHRYAWVVDPRQRRSIIVARPLRQYPKTRAA